MKTPASLRSDPPAGFTGTGGRFTPEWVAGLIGMAIEGLESVTEGERKVFRFLREAEGFIA
jgi:hypothetical protein